MAKETKDDPREKSIEERMLEFQERQLAIQERQLRAQEAQAGIQSEQLKQTAKKNLASPPLVSAFNPQGEKDYPMPRLKCEVWMPWPQTPAFHAFDWEEVELINLVEPGEYTIRLNNDELCPVVVIGTVNKVNGKLERMQFSRGWDEDARHHTALFTPENHRDFPSLRLLLRQMLGEPLPDGTVLNPVKPGRDSMTVLTLKARIARTKLPAEAPNHLPVSVGA
jgi:hypothetical protein